MIELDLELYGLLDDGNGSGLGLGYKGGEDSA